MGEAIKYLCETEERKREVCERETDMSHTSRSSVLEMTLLSSSPSPSPPHSSPEHPPLACSPRRGGSVGGPLSFACGWGGREGGEEGRKDGRENQEEMRSLSQGSHGEEIYMYMYIVYLHIVQCICINVHVCIYYFSKFHYKHSADYRDTIQLHNTIKICKICI